MPLRNGNTVSRIITRVYDPQIHLTYGLFFTYIARVCSIMVREEIIWISVK